MPKLLWIVLVGSSLFLASFKSKPTPHAKSATYDLRVDVADIANNKGLIEFALYKNPAVFTQAGKTHRLFRLDAQKGMVSYTFKDLEAGKYAVVVYHDENHNKICDKNFFGSRVAAHLYDLLDGIATDDRIVDEQDVAPLEFKRDCVEFAANGFLAL